MNAARVESKTAVRAPVLVLPVIEGSAVEPGFEGVPPVLSKQVLEGAGLSVGTDLKLLPGAAAGRDHVLRLLVKADPEVVPAESFRRAGGRLLRGLVGLEATEVELVRPAGDFDLEAFAEGFLLAAYEFVEYLSVPPVADRVRLAIRPAGDAAGDKRALARAAETAASVALAKDLIHRPANDLYPEKMAEAALVLAKRHGMKAKVVTGRALEREFPVIHAVGKGSERPPCLIRLDYAPSGKKKVPHLALCGKGITYDSGGYDIKELDYMFLMKKDMAGAAAVLGALDLVARRELPVRVTALLACAENMVSGGAYRPGDILRSRSGKTIEVKSTDAEGRLVLCDTLAYAAELAPDGIVDLATLTGLVKKYVSDVLSPAVGLNGDLVDRVVEAGRATGERVYRDHLLREFRDATKGTISDLRNWGEVNGSSAGTLVASGFLGQFVGQVPWAHVDMSNTSWTDRARDYLSNGATAFGVRLLARLVEDWDRPRA